MKVVLRQMRAIAIKKKLIATFDAARDEESMRKQLAKASWVTIRVRLQPR
jgi:hypothetical protein